MKVLRTSRFNRQLKKYPPHIKYVIESFLETFAEDMESGAVVPKKLSCPASVPNRRKDRINRGIIMTARLKNGLSNLRIVFEKRSSEIRINSISPRDKVYGRH